MCLPGNRVKLALNLVKEGKMKENDKGVFHTVGTKPIDWYDTESKICCCCGRIDMYRDGYRCIPCMVGRVQSQFKMCINANLANHKQCLQVVPIARRGMDTCSKCAYLAKIGSAPKCVLCSQCRISYTRPIGDSLPICSRCTYENNRKVPAVQNKACSTECETEECV